MSCTPALNARKSDIVSELNEISERDKRGAIPDSEYAKVSGRIDSLKSELQTINSMLGNHKSYNMGQVFSDGNLVGKFVGQDHVNNLQEMSRRLDNIGKYDQPFMISDPFDRHAVDNMFQKVLGERINNVTQINRASMSLDKLLGDLGLRTEEDMKLIHKIREGKTTGSDNHTAIASLLSRIDDQTFKKEVAEGVIDPEQYHKNYASLQISEFNRESPKYNAELKKTYAPQFQDFWVTQSMLGKNPYSKARHFSDSDALETFIKEKKLPLSVEYNPTLLMKARLLKSMDSGTLVKFMNTAKTVLEPFGKELGLGGSLPEGYSYLHHNHPIFSDLRGMAFPTKIVEPMSKFLNALEERSVTENWGDNKALGWAWGALHQGLQRLIMFMSPAHTVNQFFDSITAGAMRGMDVPYMKDLFSDAWNDGPEFQKAVASGVSMGQSFPSETQKAATALHESMWKQNVKEMPQLQALLNKLGLTIKDVSDFPHEATFKAFDRVPKIYLWKQLQKNGRIGPELAADITNHLFPNYRAEMWTQGERTLMRNTFWFWAYKRFRWQRMGQMFMSLIGRPTSALTKGAKMSYYGGAYGAEMNKALMRKALLMSSIPIMTYIMTKGRYLISKIPNTQTAMVLKDDPETGRKITWTMPYTARMETEMAATAFKNFSQQSESAALLNTFRQIAATEVGGATIPLNLLLNKQTLAFPNSKPIYQNAPSGAPPYDRFVRPFFQVAEYLYGQNPLVSGIEDQAEMTDQQKEQHSISTLNTLSRYGNIGVKELTASNQQARIDSEHNERRTALSAEVKRLIASNRTESALTLLNKQPRQSSSNPTAPLKQDESPADFFMHVMQSIEKSNEPKRVNFNLIEQP